MGEIKNLSQQEAIQKIKDLAEDIKMCMFCTQVKDMPFQTRPMGTQKVDDEGNLWFLSAASSEKNEEIKNDDEVQLIYSKGSDAHFLSVHGKATVTRDRQKIEELWNKFAQAWFKGGKDDPNLTVICVKPDDAYYWDTKHGKMVSLFKIAISSVTDKVMDDGVQGSLKP